MIYVQFPEDDPKLLVLDVEPDEKITDVKSMIEATEGIPSAEQRLGLREHAFGQQSQPRGLQSSSWRGVIFKS